MLTVVQLIMKSSFGTKPVNQNQLSIISLLAHSHTYNTYTKHWFMIYVTHFKKCINPLKEETRHKWMCCCSHTTVMALTVENQR
jgi:hypothetical protein